MERKPIEGKLLEDMHILTHPMRFRILELLADQPMHINALCRALPGERRLVSYHLTTLEDRGLVTSRYEISEANKSKGKALRVYTATDKVTEVKAELKKGFE